MTREAWARALLRGLGVPQSAPNLHAIIAWEEAEGGHWNNSARFNPLNTTQEEPGASNTGTQGNIKAYTSWQEGLQATITTLRNGLYGPILSALGRGTSAASVATAIGQSPWGTNAASIAQLAGAPAQPTPASSASASTSGTTASSASGGLSSWIQGLAQRGALFVTLVVGGVTAAGIGLVLLLRPKRTGGAQ